MDLTTHPTTAFLDELLTWFATIDQTLKQMEEHQRVSGAEPDPHDARRVLRGLLQDIFEHREPQPAPELVEQATALVAWATTAMRDELYYVPPQPPLNRAARRRMRRR